MDAQQKVRFKTTFTKQETTAVQYKEFLFFRHFFQKKKQMKIHTQINNLHATSQILSSLR